jgi:hypothetical protein
MMSGGPGYADLHSRTENPRVGSSILPLATCTATAVTEPTATLSPSPVRRRPWVAVVMSLLLPGLGHLYAGAPRRALAFWMLSLAAGTGAVAIAAVLQS